MPVAFPSKDYGPEEILHLLDQFENSLVEKTFSSIQTYSSAIDDFVRKNVIPDLEPFFRTITQNIQLFYDESDGSIIGIRESIRGVIEQLEHVSEKIEDIFRPFLQEGSFLVHGDSELLASVLEDCLCSNPNVDILILEGLPRGSGIDLLKRMKESPVVKNNPDYMKRLLLAPDSSALRLLQRRKCNFVLFGAHAVTPHGCLVNSAGSLQLATLAKESNVAVYSLCPTFKFYLSMQRMPLSSDDLDVLGNALPGAITTTTNKGGVPSTSSQCSSPTHRSSRIEGDSPIHGDVSMNSGGGMGRPQMSRNSPSIQAQQQQQSTISNASFSGPPPTIQISPQLKPTPPGSSLPQNNNNNNTGKPQLPPFGMSSSLSNNNNNNNSSSATPTEEVQGGNRSLNSNMNSNTNASVTLPSAINTVSSSGAGGAGSSFPPPQTTCGTTSVPKISPVLGATASPMMNSLIDGMNNNTNNQTQQRRNSASTPSQLAVTTPTFGSQHLTATDSNNNTNNNTNNNNNTERDPSQPNMMSHFAPTCAFQLDLIGADKITHFFTEHGVVMPWSVADKISKIFLKEIQNKRKVNRGASAAHTAGGL